MSDGATVNGVAVEGTLITGLYVDFRTKMAAITSDNEILAAIQLTPQGLVFHAGVHASTHDVAPPPPAPSVEPATRTEAVETEKRQAVTLRGRLTSKPREGRPDAKGNPTAWARFAAHEEGQDDAHMYSATFHKHTVPRALTLEKDAQLTVQGYPHEAEDSSRMDTLSIVSILDYPGKPPNNVSRHHSCGT